MCILILITKKMDDNKPKMLKAKEDGEFNDYVDELLEENDSPEDSEFKCLSEIYENMDPIYGYVAAQELTQEYEESINDERIAFWHMIEDGEII